MKTVSMSLAVLVALASSLCADEPPQTRLYVKTTPPGARIFLDGNEIGRSDALLVVGPGTHVLRVELDGYVAQEKQVQVPSERITRLELEFSKAPASTTSAPSEGAVNAGVAAVTYLRKADLPESLRDAILTVLRQHPEENRWSGQAGKTLFGIAVKALPTGAARQQAVPALLSLTHSLAVQELLKAKSLLDRYAEKGLTDSTTLGQAVMEAAGKLRIAGTVKSLQHQAKVQDGYVVAYVVAEEQDLTAQILQETELEKVKAAYRDVMHRQARDLMKAGNHKDAILLWRHLHSRKLVSQSLYLDAARCFRSLGQNEDAVRVLAEALDAFSSVATAEFLEQAGDTALGIDLPAAQQLADKAYRLASAKLLSFVSESTQPATDGLDMKNDEQPTKEPQR